ncbi:MAG: carbohydrate kinase family protein [Pseudomonadota bacterium]
MAADMAPELVTVGGLTVDNVIAADGRVGLRQAGGNGAYSAVGALMWQPRVGLVSTAPASYPRATLERLDAGGVDLGGVAWHDAQLTSCNWFIYDASGHREEGLSSPPEALAEAGFPTDRLTATQITAWRARLGRPQADDALDYSAFRIRHPLSSHQVPEAWRGARGVLLAPSQPDVMLDMISFFRNSGVMIVADPGWQLAGYPLADLAPLLSRLDAFLPSEVELRALVPGAHLSDALRVLADHCPGAVAVKLGAEGSLVWSRENDSAIPVPATPTKAVDPTGAGDSFCGGFLAGLVETGDPVKAARFGALSAAQIVAHFGADGALPVDHPKMRRALERELSPCH